MICLGMFAQKPIFDMFNSATVLIQFTNGASASGIVVADTNYVYLITARHVIGEYNETTKKIGLTGNEAYLVYYKKDVYSDKPDSLKINLVKLFEEGLVRIHDKQDIGIIRLGKILGHKVETNGLITMYKSYYPDANEENKQQVGLPGIYIDLLKTFNDVNPGDEAFLFGYPKSLKITDNETDYDYNRPLLRRGIIAGIDKNYQTIIVDCPSYQGNSGGPVYEFPFGLKDIGMVGIVSRSILLIEQSQNSYYHYV